MKTESFSDDRSALGLIAIIGVLNLLFGLIALFVRYGPITENGASALFWRFRFDPAITLPILLFALFYILGARRRRSAEEHAEGWRHLTFFGGFSAIYLALQSPLDWISDRLFFAHQIEHMLLDMVAPILLVLAAPQAALLRGLPRPFRRAVVGPTLGSAIFRFLRFFTHPAVATALFIGAMDFWMIPHMQDAALENERLHDLMHATLLASGLIFFWRVLDKRPYPLGASLGTRLFMFSLASISNILVGSFLAFKNTILYPAYGPSPHLFGIAAIDDERFGGLIMWIMGSEMLALAAILTIRHFASDEERREVRRQAVRERTADWFLERRTANRRLALGLVSFSGVILLITVGTVLVYHYAE